ncbi:MAG: imidazole glycerol phosphate synthase subunit HisH [Oscillospiraceae bacterium]|nr:imidazole glycerol phosphate synthase subunit HisH [Oscillospiraceae bacterium]
MKCEKIPGKVAIIDYKAGNAPSVLHAANKVGANAILAKTANDFEDATHIILPGVGSARATMQSLAEMGFMAELENAVLHKKVPFLGICIGMQVLFEHSEESDTNCLGWLKGNVVKFDSKIERVPQMGWNKVVFTKKTPVGAIDDYYYYVNSYYVKPADITDTWGITEYGVTFTAAACRGNIHAMQFHVEKSGETGLKLLRGFLSLKAGE